MGFGQGLSGLNAAAQELDVIGNNIANSGTVGFKSSSAAFADVYANSKVGLGTQVASINQRFTVGTISATGNQFDMAIDGAKGMFRVQDASGNILYTRNGQFYANKDNYIVNAQGQRLTGYGVNGTDLVPIMVPVGNIAPRATDGLTTKTNLDANAAVIHPASVPQTLGTIVLDDGVNPVASYSYTINDAGDVVWSGAAPADGAYTSADGSTVNIAAATPLSADDLPAQGAGETAFVAAIVGHPFDPNDAQSFTHSLPISVYDSLGNAHQLTQYFVKRESATPGESAWQVYYRMDGAPIASHPDTAPAELRFTSSGLLLSGGTQTLSVTNPGGANSPADDLGINLSYAGSTQFGGDFSPNFTQTGYPTGEYAGMSIAEDGAIVANYTNGETQAMGYIALADFNNLQGLQPVGGNAWVETGASGGPVVGRPGSNGLATLQGQSVEESNVDMSQELVNMIIAQRTYQANAQTIKTQDQVLQTLITMR
ncbi:flagellar hook-basal body complex protein [Pusillimonas noertemannii]|uniref:Flagellar hook protein FlgE n=1 Tax=Pusillimonas noertemannii TaxID=305977 RepID=A0A2U1CSL1_9BURK|nr:flagellar hook-basal body complex protein [Pusillimonas noertemannii]NYT68201.1 flagellar hook-basal body complex protein [Pusillimonas noertemannii]PVY68876.1 flagellar hook protein FlgE [Pusillimonas noertemannii]TFL11672.1 flagellar hook-basal body complex protein [Pusillimonas noertemannii]